MDNFIPLESIHIASPCSADWDAMHGDDRARFCGTCQKNVYNLSDMTRAQAEALVAEKEGHLCVQFYRRADGTVLTDDCPVPLRPARNGARWMWRGVTAGIAAVAAICGGWLVRGAEAKPSGKHPIAHGNKKVGAANKKATASHALTGIVAPPRIFKGKPAAKPAAQHAVLGEAMAVPAAKVKQQPPSRMMGSPAPLSAKEQMQMGRIAAPKPTPTATPAPPPGTTGGMERGDVAISYHKRGR